MPLVIMDFTILSVDGLGKLKTAVYLLLQHNKIDWQGSLKDTFQHYFSPRNLQPTPEVWENIASGKVNSLFQLSTPVGQAAVRLLHVKSIEEVGMVNSLMRLQPQSAGERQPLQIFAEYRENIELWYAEMRNHGLNQEDIAVMEDHLLKLNGVADTQEIVMMMSMDERISGFTVAEANFLRKSVAKKNPQVQAEVRELFYKKGRELGTRDALLDYVWNVQIRYSLGYSFSLPHVAAYSYIALQEAIIYTHYPSIYWNTACLIDDAGAFTEEDFPELIERGFLTASDKYYEIMEADDVSDVEIETTAIDRDKIATSIAMFQDTMTILPPDINSSGFGFTLNEQDNSVQVGLKTISRLGNKFIHEIIQSRPYYSFTEFLENTKISRDRVVMLIKAGAFRNITKRSRMELLKDYVYSLSSPKTTLNGRNINMLIEMNLLPDNLAHEQHNFNWYKYISKTRNIRKGYFQLDNPGLAFYNKHYSGDDLEYFDNGTFIKATAAKRYVDVTNNTIKNYIKQHHDELLEKVNQTLYDEMWDKYKMKSEADGEMEALRMYASEHPLKKFALTYDRLDTIKEDHYVGYFNIKGKRFPKHFIYSIVGTVVAKDKMKHMITLLTPEGAIQVKLWRDTFTYFDRKVTSVKDGVQITIQDSFFEVGTHLVIFGRKSNDMFYPKKYKDTGVESEIMKINIDNDLIQVEAKIDETSSD